MRFTPRVTQAVWVCNFPDSVLDKYVGVYMGKFQALPLKRRVVSAPSPFSASWWLE